MGKTGDKTNFKEILLKANQGDAEAMCSLGCCYTHGDGVETDRDKALVWYQKAVELGNARAMRELATCYFCGYGVRQNMKKAFELYHKAAAHGYTKAMYDIGHCYDEGYGVEKDIEEALKWYREAAEKGEGDSIRRLSHLYCVDKDLRMYDAEALKWIRAAAEINCYCAMEQLALWEEIVGQNETEAFRWYYKLGKTGHSTGMYLLGQCYELGKAWSKMIRRRSDGTRRQPIRSASMRNAV